MFRIAAAAAAAVLAVAGTSLFIYCSRMREAACLRVGTFETITTSLRHQCCPLRLRSYYLAAEQLICYDNRSEEIIWLFDYMP
jgi:hypothetical protein